ncbi:ECF transporter S component [Alkalibacter mobilis]|uniref:ECF transporter S component n=1 Tax=Alkalibacter mobilis TaxID=2787712 RepID=UPI00189D8028|nr:ECF transporter S component [Alkalibacter mobilis]MBF7096729.1 ECF transporter S component [Alkalibacter mobilis]
MNITLKKLIYTSLMITIVFIATVVIAIPMPLGFINLGDGAIYIASALLGPQLGFIAGAIGSALGDYYLGYFVYMIPTFLVKGTMGLVSGYLFKKNHPLKAVVAGCLIMVGGYYVSEVIIYSNFLSPLASIPFNLLQGAVGSAIGYVFFVKFRKMFAGLI